ncbi:hypothetical protein F5884DRAFT_523553 [Xylogone sp. PMI_703]|nr:hypothetical protein F5884DRAFT_523553 [Xylogone sp. PMI_703]
MVASISKPLGLHEMGQQSADCSKESSSSSIDLVPEARKLGAADLSSHFNQSQIALALVIGKTRPEGVSMKEYLQQLKARVKVRRGLTPGQSQRFIDTVEFWKDQYMRIHEEKKRCDERISKLQAEKHDFIRKHSLSSGQNQKQPLDLFASNDHNGVTTPSSSPINDQSIAVPPRKRRATSEDIVDWLQGKQNQVPRSEEAVGKDPLHISRQILILIRQRVELDRLCQQEIYSTYLGDVEQKCTTILQLMTNILNKSISQQFSRQDRQTGILLQLLFHQLDLSYRSCFDSLTHLCQTIPGRAKRHTIVYNLVKFFGDALALLRSLCSSQSDYDSSREAHRGAKRARTEKPPTTENAVMNHLSTCLASILLNLNWQETQSSHADILEGILYFILRRTGALVSEITFKEEVASSDLPGNISKTDGTEDSTKQHAIMLECRYVWPVIQAAFGGNDAARKGLIMRVLARNPSSTVKGKGTVSMPPLGGDGSAGELLGKEMMRLQYTLVRSIIGEVPEVPFQEVLKLPFKPETEEAEAEAGPLTEGGDVEKDGSNWFIDSIWTLIGWDLLMSEGDVKK